MATDFTIPVFSGLDDMFNTSKDSVSELRIAEIDDFASHTFKVIDNEDMAELVESIKTNGVITPILVRQKSNNRYEIIAGHRRRRAAVLAGLSKIPAVIRKLSDDEAIIAMVDTNLQREKLLPSEKARSYKAKLEAMKRQGKRTDLTSCQLGTKYRADEKMAENNTDSARQIQRYIRLNNLIPTLLDLVDEEKIKLIPAVELSFLPINFQEALIEAMTLKSKKSISLKEAKTLRATAENTNIDAEGIIEMLWPEKPAAEPDKEAAEKETAPQIPHNIMKYFAKGTSLNSIWAKIERLLKDDAELQEAGLDFDM